MPAPRACSNTPACCSCRRRSRSTCSTRNARSRLKLYVRRVFITDEGTELLPAYLRFVRGVVDSEDLPLNISREMLQSNPTVARIRQQLTRRVLGELGKKASEAPEEYAKFWDNFGAVLKEGLYEDREQRDDAAAARAVPLDDARRAGLARRVCRGDAAGPGGDLHDHRRQSRPVAKEPAARRLPRARRRGAAADRPDRRILGASVGTYKEKPFKSATRGGADLDKIAPPEDKKAKQPKPEPPAKLASLIAIFKLALGDAVKDVRSSERLTDSAVCLVADEGDMDMHLERLLKQHRQLDTAAKRILELNPRHRLIERLAASVGETGASEQLSEFAWLLLDQARIVEGEQLPDPSAFARRLAMLLERGLPAAA